jgi:hypothetical protein
MCDVPDKVPVMNLLNTMLWRNMVGWRYSTIILYLGTRWRWVVSFTPRSLYPQARTPVTFGQEAGWAPESVLTLWRRKKPFPLPGIESRPSGQSLYRLNYRGSQATTHYLILRLKWNLGFLQRWLKNSVLLAVSLILDVCLTLSSTLKMEATCPSEMSFDSHRITLRYISEDRNLSSSSRGRQPESAFGWLQSEEFIHTLLGSCCTPAWLALRSWGWQ